MEASEQRPQNAHLKRGGSPGRPHTLADDQIRKNVLYLVGIGCTNQEIAGYCNVAMSQVERWWNHRMYGPAMRQAKQGTKIGVRRAQRQAMERGNVQMILHLSRVYLGERDGVDELVHSGADVLSIFQDIIDGAKNQGPTGVAAAAPDTDAAPRDR